MYIENSGITSGFQYPFGYLKASSNLTAVNLFIMPYNYPKLIPLIGECMCACVYVRASVHVPPCVYVRPCTCLCVCVHAHLCVCASVYVYMCVIGTVGIS